MNRPQNQHIPLRFYHNGLSRMKSKFPKHVGRNSKGAIIVHFQHRDLFRHIGHVVHSVSPFRMYHPE